MPATIFFSRLQAALDAPEVRDNTERVHELLLDELIPKKDSRLSPMAAAAFRGNTSLFDEVVKTCKDKDKDWSPEKVGDIIGAYVHVATVAFHPRAFSGFGFDNILLRAMST